MMTRYGFPGARTHGGEGRHAGLFALMRAWAAGIVVLALTEYLQVTLAYENLTGIGGPQSFGGRVLLVDLPNAVCVLLATWAAAGTHRSPFRDAPVRHLAASVAVPVAAQLLSVLAHGDDMTLVGLSMSTAVLALGCTAGMAADRLRRTRG